MFSKKLLMPVIHVESTSCESIFQNIDKCLSANIKAIWLISHGYLNFVQLKNVFKKVKKKYPNLWIGCNFLDLDQNIFSQIKDIKLDGIWIDNSYQGLAFREIEAEKLYLSWKNSNFNGIYFGGVAFKYCEQPFLLEKAVFTAKNCMDIITTSGVSTGTAADLKKLSLMKRALNKGNPAKNTKLAVASGISILNIKDQIKFADFFIVSSSLESSSGVFSLEKLIELNLFIENFNLSNS